MVKQLEDMARKLVIHSLKSTSAAGSGHPTTCMSCADIMSALFFSPEGLEEDDEFILSKGHAAPILWAAYAEAGVFPVEDLMNLRKIDSYLEGHPTFRMPMIKFASGSLGQGLSAGVGMALAKKLDKNRGLVYVLLGDGEIAEGSVWEAVDSAGYHKLDNLCAIVDVNRLGQSQATMHAHNLKAYEDKFKAAGWDTSVIYGHSMRDVLKALSAAKNRKTPYAIIAKTFKGHGVSFLQDKDGWHGKPLKQDDLDKALLELGQEPKLQLNSNISKKDNKINYPFIDFETTNYVKDQKVATRGAFGNALVNLGKKNPRVVALDGDVKNSTMQQDFFKQFPDRGFEFFIAEQNMTGAGAGFSAMGFIPFVATFGAFLARAYDFIRMAQYSNANIKFVGSHAGVSIGEDGPSQMGLEDLSMFLAMPDSVVLYPCDAVSTERLVKQVAKHKGISYLRTTREKTPVIYDNHEKFPIGGLKVLKQSKNDKALVIGAGVTVFEALKAYDALKNKRKNIRVIDLYSIKPLDEKALINNAKECNNNVIVVEDHYNNGIGPQVAKFVGPIKHLYVKEIPRSGKPEELRAKYGINANAIIKAVK